MSSWMAFLKVMVVLGAVFTLGCGDGSPADGQDGSSGLDGSSGVDGGTDTDAGSGPDSGTGLTPTFGSGSNFGAVSEFFDMVNAQRQSYSPHDRYAGFPFTSGYYHTNVTWPMMMQWSDSAAAAAQAEADAVAGGATPSGTETFANPGQLPLYVDGLNTVDYMVGGRERPGSFTTDTCTLCNSNPFMRMAVFYHDPGGDGPVLTRLGIGAADMGNGDTWWVMRFEP